GAGSCASLCGVTRARAQHSPPAAATTIKSLLTMEGGSFGSCRSTADLGRSALLSQLGPTPGPARRSLGETRAAAAPGFEIRLRRGLLRDDMDCAESWLERAGRGASTRSPRAATPK